MEEDYVYLMQGPVPICKLNEQILRDAGIEAKIEVSSTNAFQTMYGANAWTGNSISVPASKLEAARELLNIQEDDDSTPKPQQHSSTAVIVAKIILVLGLISILVPLIL